MKYVVAVLSSAFIFVAVFFLLGMLLYMIVPRSWVETIINFGIIQANIPSAIAFVLALAAGTHTFRASLRAKTGKLYKANKTEKEQNCNK